MKKRQIIKIAIILLSIIAVSVGIYFICKACGITDVSTLQNIIQGFGAWGIVMFIIIRVVMTLFMCFVPAISMIFDLLSVALFGANWIAFLVSLSSIMICSTIMYVLGRTGAYGIFEKIE